MFSTGAAQSPPYLFDGRVVSSTVPGGLLLQIQLDDNPWSGNVWLVTPAGIDVYRQVIGSGCGTWQVVTDEPVPWTWIDNPGGGPYLAFEFLDDTAQPNNGYLYQARAVDADRNPIPENAPAYLGAATHGVALLGHGTLYGGPGGCGLSYTQEVGSSCDLQCYPPLLVYDMTPEVEPYLNSGTVVLMYGTITGVSLYCGVNIAVGSLASAVPSECTILPVEQKTWGTIKQLFR